MGLWYTNERNNSIIFWDSKKGKESLQKEIMLKGRT